MWLTKTKHRWVVTNRVNVVGYSWQLCDTITPVPHVIMTRLNEVTHIIKAYKVLYNLYWPKCDSTMVNLIVSFYFFFTKDFWLESLEWINFISCIAKLYDHCTGPYCHECTVTDCMGDDRGMKKGRRLSGCNDRWINGGIWGGIILQCPNKVKKIYIKNKPSSAITGMTGVISGPIFHFTWQLSLVQE